MPTSFAGSLSPKLHLQPGSRVPPPSPTSRTESLFCRVFILLGVGPPFSLARFDENINFYDSATPSGCFRGDGDGQFFWKGGLHQPRSKIPPNPERQTSRGGGRKTEWTTEHPLVVCYRNMTKLLLFPYLEMQGCLPRMQ